MKTIFALLILISLLALPALGALEDADLDKIRLIVKEEVDGAKAEIKTEMTLILTKIDTIDTRLRSVETGVAELRGRDVGISFLKDWGVALCALGALIVSIIALRRKQPIIPQPTQDPQKAVSQ